MGGPWWFALTGALHITSMCFWLYTSGYIGQANTKYEDRHILTGAIYQWYVYGYISNFIITNSFLTCTVLWMKINLYLNVVWFGHVYNWPVAFDRTGDCIAIFTVCNYGCCGLESLSF